MSTATGYPAAQQQQIAEQPPAAPVEQPALPDPISVLDGQLKVLQDSFAQRAQRVKDYGFKKAEEHNYHIDKLQSEYDARKLEIMKVRSTLETVQKAVADGFIDQEAGAKAMYGLVLPKEVMSAMYPKPEEPQAEPSRRPYSPRALEDYTVIFEEFAEDSKLKNLFGGYKSLDPVSQQNIMIRQYLAARTNVGYSESQMTTAEQRQLDSEWDAVMRTKGYKWDPTAPEIKSLRTYGDPVLRAAANKVSPMARSLAAQQKRQQKKAADPARLRVRIRETGQTGTILADEFDPAKHDKVQ